MNKLTTNKAGLYVDLASRLLEANNSLNLCSCRSTIDEVATALKDKLDEPDLGSAMLDSKTRIEKSYDTALPKVLGYNKYFSALAQMLIMRAAFGPSADVLASSVDATVLK